ncbi:MAG: formylglycine-generating enzyme family protein [Spirochaetaceae bacterium]
MKKISIIILTSILNLTSLFAANSELEIESLTGIDLVLVEAGTFYMGSENGQENERPVHIETILKDYYIGKYEVTQKLWQKVMGNNPSQFKNDNSPVEKVSWYETLEFCNKLSEIEGLTPAYNLDDGLNDKKITIIPNSTGYRLPTEVQWEYAARGGNKSLRFKFSGGNNVNNVGWYEGNSKNITHPVGSKQPNELGIYDMTGNVFEWCYNFLNSYKRGFPDNPFDHAIRGGSWYYHSSYMHVSFRFPFSPHGRGNNIGFRISRPVN